jgi:hypothetical protein
MEGRKKLSEETEERKGFLTELFFGEPPKEMRPTISELAEELSRELALSMPTVMTRIREDLKEEDAAQ